MEMTDINNLFFELIQVAIGTRTCLSHTPNVDEWGELYSMAKKQSLVGICFAGVQKLVEQQRTPEEMLYLTWMGMAAKIQQRNEVVNRQCIELQARLAAEGLRSCILKGQGVAQSYAESLRGLRQSGDIDVWVLGTYENTLRHLKDMGVVGKITAMHAEAEFFADTEVEMHPWPARFRCPWTDKRWRLFCREHEVECFDNKVSIGSKEFNEVQKVCVPTTEFNLVFLMVHMYQHTLREGIGLRQFLDYYFALSAVQRIQKVQEVQRTQEAISELGMKRFVAGVMYVMQVVFNIDEKMLLCPADEDSGRLLLDEIMIGGNFGRYDVRNAVAMGKDSNPMQRVWRGVVRNMRFLRFGVWEVACSPIWRLWHFCWMKKNGYR